MSDKIISHTAWQGNNGGGINGTLLIFLWSLPAFHISQSIHWVPQLCTIRAREQYCTSSASTWSNQSKSMKHGGVGAMREALGEHWVTWGHRQRWMAQSFPASGFWSQQVKVQPPWQMQPSSLEGFKLRSKGIKQQWANECVVPGSQSCPDAHSSSLMRRIKMHHLCMCVYIYAYTHHFLGKEYNSRNYFFHCTSYLDFKLGKKGRKREGERVSPFSVKPRWDRRGKLLTAFQSWAGIWWHPNGLCNFAFAKSRLP